MMIWFTQMSFGRTAQDLTVEHLYEQIESYSLLVDHLTGVKPLPKRNPVPYMWDGYLCAALIGGMCSGLELYMRRYEDTTFWKFSRLADKMRAAGEFRYEAPHWFRDKDVIRSHRSVLMARFPDSYGDEEWPGTPTRMPLLWPVEKTSDGAVAALRVAKADLPRLMSGECSIPANISERVVNL